MHNRAKLRGKPKNEESGFDTATLNAIVVNALKAAGVENPVIPGYKHA